MNIFGTGESSKADLTVFGLDNDIDIKTAQTNFDVSMKAAETAGHNQKEKEIALNKAKALIPFLNRDEDKGRSWVKVAKLEPTQESKQAALDTARPLFIKSSNYIDMLWLRDMARMEKEMNSDISATVSVMERVAKASVKSETRGFIIMMDTLKSVVSSWFILLEFTDVPEKKLSYLSHAKEAYLCLRPSESVVGFLLVVAEMEKEIDPTVGKRTEELAQNKAKDIARGLCKLNSRVA